jgi:hypothetical protein
MRYIAALMVLTYVGEAAGVGADTSVVVAVDGDEREGLAVEMILLDVPVLDELVEGVDLPGEGRGAWHVVHAGAAGGEVHAGRADSASLPVRRRGHGLP